MVTRPHSFYPAAGSCRGPREQAEAGNASEGLSQKLHTVTSTAFCSPEQGQAQLERNEMRQKVQFSSVQFSRSVVSDSLRPHESQHARPPCPAPTPGVR